jgi:glycogen synthase
VRVLSIGNMYPPHHYGGYELVWKAAVEHLRRGGHEVRVLTTDADTGAVEPDPPWVHRELSWHLRDGEFDRLGPRRRVALARHNHGVLERHLRDLRPDVVAWWSMGGLTLTMLEAVRRKDLPAVAFVHDEWLDYGQWVDPWLSLFRGRSRLAPLGGFLAGIPASVDFAGAAKYVFVSECMREHGLDLGLGLRRTEVAHSGIDPAFLDPAPAHEWRWRLLYVGRLDPRKGVDTAIEALGQLPHEACLTVVGGWDRREERALRQLAGRHGVGERVVFAGHRSRRELMGAYAEADAVVFPVRWREPWGLVPLESMARGRPVVATGRGGSGEYLRDGENCLLFEPDDARGLADALGRLASDPHLRARLREAGIDTAARYTEPIFNAAVEKAMLEAAGRAAARRASDSHAYA